MVWSPHECQVVSHICWRHLPRLNLIKGLIRRGWLQVTLIVFVYCDERSLLLKILIEEMCGVHCYLRHPWNWPSKINYQFLLSIFIKIELSCWLRLLSFLTRLLRNSRCSVALRPAELLLINIYWNLRSVTLRCVCRLSLNLNLVWRCLILQLRMTLLSHLLTQDPFQFLYWVTHWMLSLDSNLLT